VCYLFNIDFTSNSLLHLDWLHEQTLTCLRYSESCSVSEELPREVTQCDYCGERNTQKPGNKGDRILPDCRKERE
jgi:hypothetical protein